MSKIKYPDIDIDNIREFLQDFPSLNILKDNTEQFSDELIETTIPMVVQEAITKKPSLRSHITKIANVVWMYGIVSKLLQSESFLQLRNSISVADNNNPGTQLFGKESSYIQMSNMFQQQFEIMLDNEAKKLWYGGLWGGAPSHSMDVEGGELFMDSVGFNY
jgi:hypothetical protein